MKLARATWLRFPFDPLPTRLHNVQGIWFPIVYFLIPHIGRHFSRNNIIGLWRPGEIFFQFLLTSKLQPTCFQLYIIASFVSHFQKLTISTHVGRHFSGKNSSLWGILCRVKRFIKKSFKNLKLSEVHNFPYFFLKLQRTLKKCIAYLRLWY